MSFKIGDKVRYIGHWVDGYEGAKRHRPDSPYYPPIGAVGKIFCCDDDDVGDYRVWNIKWPKGTLPGVSRDSSLIYQYALELEDKSDALPSEPPCNPTWEELTGFEGVV